MCVCVCVRVTLVEVMRAHVWGIPAPARRVHIEKLQKDGNSTKVENIEKPHRRLWFICCFRSGFRSTLFCSTRRRLARRTGSNNLGLSAPSRAL